MQKYITNITEEEKKGGTERETRSEDKNSKICEHTPTQV